MHGMGLTHQQRAPHAHRTHPLDPDRQPLRNRHPRDARRRGDAHPHRRHLFAAGPPGAAPFQGRRELPGRRRPEAAGRLPGRRRHPAHRQARRRRCHPPGLRLPVGEPRLRREGHRRRAALDRPEPGSDAHAGQQGGGAPCRGGGRRGGDAGHPAAALRRGRMRPAGGRHRLPGDAQGQLGRRRARHACHRIGRRAAGGAGSLAARGAGRLRQRRGLFRKADPPCAPRRGADPGRPARQSGASARARLHRAEAQPEGGGTRPGALHGCGRPRRAVRQRAEADAVGGLHPCRHGRVPDGCRRRQVLLHRGQPAHPGGAHGHRDDHRRGHRQGADPHHRRRLHRRHCRCRRRQAAHRRAGASRRSR